MSKLKLVDIKKTYDSGEIVHALTGISLEFRESEFVSILGPSGCGKTTMLNIIGGLDRYTSGNLIIGGLSTKNFKDKDWDAYRNRSIGFVFQNYNLIGHQSVLQNVEIAMTLSGVSAFERKRRAREALSSVGLADQMKKKPNQLSGGQMQRVAIARALVNNPDIILADEPTGSLDSHTSIQVMEILKEISKTKLVIMVTHNGSLAEEYSSRIIKLLDGEVQSDSNPLFKDEDKKAADNEQSNSPKKKLSKTAMSMTTAASLSFKNLLTKKGRTIITSFAGSIGIIGVALVLALSSGLTSYMNSMQADTLAGFPISITRTPQNIHSKIPTGDDIANVMGNDEEGKFIDSDVVYNYDRTEGTIVHTNKLTDDYFEYVAALPDVVPDSVNNISYTRGVGMNVLAKENDTVVKYETSRGGRDGNPFESGGGLFWQEMPDNEAFILSLYDLIGSNSRMPENKNEILLVVDEYNRIDRAFFNKLGITSNNDYKLSDFIGKEILSVVPNDKYYSKDGNLYTAATANDYDSLYSDEGSVRLTVTGILRIKEGAATSYFSQGFVYTAALTDYIVANAEKSDIARAQVASDKNVMTGVEFEDSDAKDKSLLLLGADTTPVGINIYPKNFESKGKIKEYLNAYNDGKSMENQIAYTDMAETVASMGGTLIDTVSLVLIGFAAVSLLVSTIMIAIITYVSVLERTKEIGILRAVGGRKKDISRVFNAEAAIIGFVAGALGVGLTYALSIPINMIVQRLVGIDGIAVLSPLYAILLILGSMALTLIAGFIPSRMAAKKDPVVALRTE